MKILTIILLLALTLIVTKKLFFSFKSQSPADYAGTGPDFVLKKQLSGRILSEGLIYGPNGKMTNSFVAEMLGEWDGDKGTLSESFTYANGRKQERKWYLTIVSENTFTATADDIVGTAQGVISGSTVKLTYDIILPKEAGGYVLNATDWMYLTDNGVIMNKSEMRKFGIKVAELIATMRPNPDAQ
jgi:hypothetical protein